MLPVYASEPAGRLVLANEEGRPDELLPRPKWHALVSRENARGLDLFLIDSYAALCVVCDAVGDEDPPDVSPWISASDLDRAARRCCGGRVLVTASVERCEILAVCPLWNHRLHRPPEPGAARARDLWWSALLGRARAATLDPETFELKTVSWDHVAAPPLLVLEKQRLLHRAVQHWRGSRSTPRGLALRFGRRWRALCRPGSRGEIRRRVTREKGSLLLRFDRDASFGPHLDVSRAERLGFAGREPASGDERYLASLREAVAWSLAHDPAATGVGKGFHAVEMAQTGSAALVAAARPFFAAAYRRAAPGLLGARAASELACLAAAAEFAQDDDDFSLAAAPAPALASAPESKKRGASQDRLDYINRKRQKRARSFAPRDPFDEQVGSGGDECFDDFESGSESDDFNDDDLGF
jgi:hypothetical protein